MIYRGSSFINADVCALNAEYPPVTKHHGNIIAPSEEFLPAKIVH
jgi:hypothetical protein